jgi:hypothetical protein
MFACKEFNFIWFRKCFSKCYTMFVKSLTSSDFENVCVNVTRCSQVKSFTPSDFENVWVNVTRCSIAKSLTLSDFENVYINVTTRCSQVKSLTLPGSSEKVYVNVLHGVHKQRVWLHQVLKMFVWMLHTMFASEEFDFMSFWKCLCNCYTMFASKSLTSSDFEIVCVNVTRCSIAKSLTPSGFENVYINVTTRCSQVKSLTLPGSSENVYKCCNTMFTSKEFDFMSFWKCLCECYFF